MASLNDFLVKENKVWYTGGHWPTGVPHQIKDIEDVFVSPMFEGFCTNATKYGYWDKDVCISVLGAYIERITFRKLVEMAKKFGTFLHDTCGINQGDCVAIDFPNSINFVVAYLGILYCGAVMAGVNPQYKPIELNHCLVITKAKALVLMDALWIAGPDQLLGKENRTQIKSVISTNLLDFITAKGEVFDKIRARVPSFQDKVPDKTDTVMITIGSIPFFHSFGLTCVMSASLSLGMVMLLFPKPPADEDLCEAINKIDAPQGIMYTGVEMLFKRLTDFVATMGEEAFKKKYDFWKKLKYATQGAGPLHDYVRTPFEKVFCPIRSGYGLTETSPVASVAPFWGPYKPEKLGLPLSGVDWIIVDPETQEVICDGTKEKGNFGVDHTGEIALAGPMVMKGYLGGTEPNIVMIGGQRWLLTGDIGFLDEQGYCEIRDRKKSLIKVSGHSVFPKEVEELMGQHEKIDEVAVAGVPDRDQGEAVKAWVTLKKGFKADVDITSDQLKEWCKKNMTAWKCPKYIEFTKGLPVSMTGKVLRRELQEKDVEKIKKGKEIKG